MTRTAIQINRAQFTGIRYVTQLLLATDYMRIKKRIQILSQQLTDIRALTFGRWAILNFLNNLNLHPFLPELKVSLAYMTTNMNLLNYNILKPENSAGQKKR